MIYIASHQRGIAGCTEHEVCRISVEADTEKDALELASGGWPNGVNPNATQGGAGKYNDYWMIETEDVSPCNS